MQVGLESARAVGAEADALAGDLVRVDNVLQDGLVDGRQSSAIMRTDVRQDKTGQDGCLVSTCEGAFASAGGCCAIPCG